MNLQTGIAVVVGLFAAAWIFAASFGWMLGEPAAPQWQQSYACGEFLVNASFSDDLSVLYVEGVGDPLVLTPSDSGALYENDLFSFFYQGEGLTISNRETGIVLAECVPVTQEGEAPMNFGD